LTGTTDVEGKPRRGESCGGFILAVRLPLCGDQLHRLQSDTPNSCERADVVIQQKGDMDERICRICELF
jgi:hypothetical protein